jgi:dinuclear metal center YbgI/SA1388 family protein
MKKRQSVSVSSVVSYLDKELKVKDIADASNNGLQVENSGKVSKVCCGVDASLEFFEAARDRGANLLIVHHGLSWKDSLKRITKLNYKWVKFLMDNDMALYGCHLPLDTHPKYGNNVLIGKALGLKGLKPVGSYDGSKIAWSGNIPGGMRYASFKKKVEAVFGRELSEMHFGPGTVKKVVVVSGGGCGLLSDAEDAGADMFVSGEPNLAGRNFLKDSGMNALFGGHYATEIFGVKALAGVVKRKFGIPAEFIDLRIEY